MPSSPGSPTVLILTSSLWGQAGVLLATSYELALAGANVYVSSSASLGNRVRSLQDLAARHASSTDNQLTGSIVFREFPGLTPLWDALGNHGINSITLPHPPGYLGASKTSKIIREATFPWNLEEHLGAIETTKQMIATIKPHVVVIEVTFLPAIDACKLVGQNFVILYPNAIKELAQDVQPNLAALWKFPAPMTGFPFPLKWWQIPLNICLCLQLMSWTFKTEEAQKIVAARKSLGIEAMSGFHVYDGVKYVCPALPEIDFPFAIIPEAIVPCGPIVVPFDPLEESDPTLMTWLNNGPTVLVNLGSLVVLDEKMAREMAGAFRILLDYHDRKGTGNFQIFWKAKTTSDIRKVIDDIIAKEIEEGKVKVVAWVDVEPVSILQHPNVVCTVHHGGANSYYEGVWSGLPHVVLPVWFDTYDYANRAEFLNIGIFGNKSCAPGVQAEEFGRALTRVTGHTDEADKFRSAAKRLKDICEAKGNGRKLACETILEVGMTS